MSEVDDKNKTQTYSPLAEGTQVGHYRIVQRIGAGGMGEVYLAEDGNLKRLVALKFLPARFCSDPQFKTRFMREAEATARLNHPNVVVIHNVGEFEDRPYFAMEHVDGISLRDLMRKEKLEFDRIVELVIGLCDGLQAAHDKKVIHRDIKPANIVIDSYGKPKILDFGLAAIQGTEHLTRTGSTMGTVQYMSPEQAEGRPVDARSDLFSLGVVLYELIAGCAPFARDSEASTIRAIASATPEPLARYRAGVSDDLQRIVSRLLERDPSRRYQTAGDVRADLSRLTDSAGNKVARATPQEESIVVVPFENLGSDPENEYFSDGLTEEIITALGKIGGVRVISRKSSMQLKGSDKDVRAIGRAFDVRYVLTGSVRRSGENIRVNAELVEAANEQQLWAERYKGTMEDVFDIQEQIARAIAEALKVRLSVSEKTALANRGVRDPHVYDLYLRSRQETERWTREGLDRAHELLVEAIRLEPDSATLQAALGYNYYNYVNMGFHQEESLTKAKQCAERAFQLDPESVDALRLRGVIGISIGGKPTEGIRILEKVLAKSPHDAEAMWWVALGYAFRGRSRQGVEIAERLVQDEPYVVLNQGVLAWARYLDGDFTRALRGIEAAYAREPDNALVQFSRALIQLYNGLTEEAADYIHIAESRATLGLFDNLVLVQIYAMQGDREKVDAIMTEDFKNSVRRDIQYPWHVAVARTLLGDYDEAIDWLTLAIDNGFGVYRFLEELDPYLAPLRDDPRFKELVVRARQQATQEIK